MHHSTSTIRVAITGTTNSGKTTYAHTFLCYQAGEIGDGTITAEAAEWEHPDLTDARGPARITFVDCPGFENPALFRVERNIIKNAEKNGGQHIVPRLRETLGEVCSTERDEKAFGAILDADVVLYVADVKETPKESHENELLIIRETGKPIICLLNKIGANLACSSEREQCGRILLWTSTLSLYSEYVMELDAHWHSPRKLT